MSTTISPEITSSLSSKIADVGARVSAVLSDTDTDTKDLLLELKELEKELSHSLDALTKYDQAQFQNRIKELEKELDTLNAAKKKKSKFAFKGTKPKDKERSHSTKPSTGTPSAPTPSSHTPPGTPPQKLFDLSSLPPSTLHISSHSDSYLSLSSISSKSPDKGSILISDLKRCVVGLEQEEFGSVHMQDVERSLVVLKVTEGSVIVHGLKDCVLFADCRQLRIHHSHNSTFLVPPHTNSIIEYSSSLKFAVHPQSLHPTETSTEMNIHLKVQDFDNPLLDTSPNWIQFEARGARKVWDEVREKKDVMPLEEWLGDMRS
ncbi:hypothetical protein BT69DRAFT_1332991 [Atractiella rhizophila]|nr:hypothetical protein BT69DRAFT_1332991 [Atractiella rhizophila]